MVANLSQRIADLTDRRVPFVHATVVRAQGPSSAKAGDQAIVLADGSIEGFVGGQCASGSVRTAALGALENGESLLLRVLPGEESDFPEADGAQVVVNPCLSGGAIEIFLEPLLPSPMLSLMGTTPTANAVADLAQTLGFVITQADDLNAKTMGEDTVAVIIASHGGDEAGAIGRALEIGIPFVGLVASTRRAEGVLSALTVEQRGQVHAPVGFDIGARTPPEIALSIMADLVQRIRRDGLVAHGHRDVSAPLRVIDPVCGMTVTVVADTPHAVLDGADFWFCGTGCRDSFIAEHAAARP